MLPSIDERLLADHCLYVRQSATMRINLLSILLDLLFVKHLTSQQQYLRALRFLLEQ